MVDNDIDLDQLKKKVYQIINSNSENRSLKAPKDTINNLEKMVLLQILDDKWKDHINNLEQLRQTIGLRGYGQRDPLNEYKNEAFGLFEDLLSSLKMDVSKIFSRMILKKSVDNESDSQKDKQDTPINKKIPRNSTCPCGSGKKYKHCHGKI